MKREMVKVRRELQAKCDEIKAYCKEHGLVLRYDCSEPSRSLEVHPENTEVVPEGDGQGIGSYDWDNVPSIDLGIEAYKSGYSTIRVDGE